MNDYYDAIYFSPHLDDVALSCGGQIYQRTQTGQQVLIISIAAGDPPDSTVSSYAQSLHERWELAADAVAARRAEDIIACQILGAKWLHWELPDCIYRYHPETGVPFYRSDPDIFGEVHEAELPLIARLQTQMRSLPAHGEVIAPLTLGNHVDHTLTRLAAEAAFGVEQLWYYEDYPYAQQDGALTKILPAGHMGWEEKTIPIGEEALQAKYAAIEAFQSQLSTFFTDHEDLVQQVGGYVTRIGGERLWRQK